MNNQAGDSPVVDESDIRQRVAQALSEMRRQLGKYQAEVAEAMGNKQASVSAAERDGLTSVVAIAAYEEALGAAPGAILMRAGLVSRQSVAETLASSPELSDAGRSYMLATFDMVQRTMPVEGEGEAG